MIVFGEYNLRKSEFNITVNVKLGQCLLKCCFWYLPSKFNISNGIQELSMNKVKNVKRLTE
jgi:hypothetical protein